MSGGLDDLLGGLGGKGGLQDLLGGLLGGGGGAAGSGGADGMGGLMAALAPMLGSLLSGGGLQKVLSGFQEQGMGDKVDSWVSTGSNEPVSGGEVEQALGREQMAQIAQQLGIPEEQAASVVANVLPDLVDRLSPEGELPDEGSLDELAGSLRGMGGR
ncbi:MAG TPA: YidB family protein [Gaiellaceae bacterium]|nr:YidB family protein [Gaiellaceae bacterium]